MSITIGGKIPQSISIGGKAVESLSIGGEVVWSAGPLNYFYFEDISGSNNTLTLTRNNSNGQCPVVTLEYSTDGVNWQEWQAVNDVRTYTIPANGKFYLRGDNTSFGQNANGSDYHQFASTGNIEAHGSIMTLLDKTGASDTTTSTGCFRSLFSNMTTLKTAPELPATILADSCYDSMFRGCTSLVEAPELPATTLATNCYHQMFYDCTSLTTAPVLPAHVLFSACYDSMFWGCTSLVEAPELPATTLAQTCYTAMFYNCTSLVEAPELPATILAQYCYASMFRGCSSLNKITVYTTEWNSGSNTGGWVDGVSSTGDFYNLGGATISTGTSGIPTNWTVHTSL